MKYMASIRSEEAVKIAGWIRERGGLAVWPSVDLSDPGKQLLTPARERDGQPTFKPHWSVVSEPSVIITDPAEVEVCEDVEVKRFRVGIRRGAQGFKLKVTDGGSRRIRAAVEKAGKGSYHVFDYETQEAVIMAPRKTWPLSEHIEQRLEYLRGEIIAERISYGELAELRSLTEYIKPGDVLLLEWAGVPEFPEEKK